VADINIIKKHQVAIRKYKINANDLTAHAYKSKKLVLIQNTTLFQNKKSGFCFR